MGGEDIPRASGLEDEREWGERSESG